MREGRGRILSRDEQMMTRNSDTIYVYIQSYELGKAYFKRALDSIRNQTWPNFRCLIYDNGSGSEVRRELQEYVSQDQRFSLTCFDNTKGRVLAWEYGIPEILRMAGDTGGYFFRLDADDELELSCFEKLVGRIKTDSLDMCAGGAVFLDGETGNVLGNRKIDENIILEGKLFEEYFPVYYQIMRTHWAKLYRVSLPSLSTTVNRNVVSPSPSCFSSAPALPATAEVFPPAPFPVLSLHPVINSAIATISAIQRMDDSIVLLHFLCMFSSPWLIYIPK